MFEGNDRSSSLNCPLLHYGKDDAYRVDQPLDETAILRLIASGIGSGIVEDDGKVDLLQELLNAPRPFQPIVGSVVVFPGGKLVPLCDWQMFVAAVLAWHRLTLTLRSVPDEPSEEVDAEHKLI